MKDNYPWRDPGVPRELQGAKPEKRTSQDFALFI